MNLKMGGAKCSYRNCTVKTDRKTHLFHFPVFDKLRCHQWITNAQKLNFLSLKLSQLKNRMICEHHFTNDSFMNDMKAKLKITAVPTEDGPFCNPVKKLEAEDENKEMLINLDDIENDYLTNFEKKKHFSVKYGDFLTNDVSEPNTVAPSYKSTSILVQDSGLIFNRYNHRMISHSKELHTSPKNVTSFKCEQKTRSVDTKAKDVLENEKKESASTLFQSKPLPTPNPKVVDIQFDELNLEGKKHENPPEELPQTKVFPSHKIKSTTIHQNKKVKIISEKKISEPVIVCKSELQPVSPSVVINVSNRKQKTNVTMNGTEINTFYVDMLNPQQIEHVQGLNNSCITQCQPAVTDQMNLLPDYNQPILLTNTIESSNSLEVQNVDPLMNSKDLDYNMTSEDRNRTQFKPESELLTDVEPIQMVPNIEFVSTSSTGPSVFTLTDIPQATNSSQFTDSIFVPHVAPTEILDTYPVSTDAKVLAGTSGSQEHVSSILKNRQNAVRMSKAQNNYLEKKPQTVQSNPKTKSFLKSKIPPEKLAAIEEKRKFNMKLRDIINSCLSKLDEESDASKLTAAMKKELSEKKVGEHFSSNCSLPTSQENVIAYLETRLQKMEDTMLSKIEQNTQRIIEMKKSIVKPLSRKKSASTQTYVNSKSIKKNLYQQISQFLTPEVNSLIYEELFLNDCIVSNTQPSPKKRKRK